MKQTTLMIRNIPIKFTQEELLELVNENFEAQFDYFYLPKDNKTQCGVGFAFINFVDALYIVEFFLQFNCIKWSDKIQKCNSNKYCDITYANVQGLEEIKNELADKNIMKKIEGTKGPQFYDNVKPDQQVLESIKRKYLENPQLIHIKIEEFNRIEEEIIAQKEQ